MSRRRPDLFQETLALVDMAYECATAPDQWPTFLARLASATNSRGTTFLVQDLASQNGEALWAHGFSQDVLNEYRTWGSRNYYLERITPFLRSGFVARGEDIVPDRDVMKTAYFNEYLVRADAMHHVGACLFLEQRTLALLFAFRAIGKPSHSDEERRVIEILTPHLQRAIAIQQKLGDADLRRSAADDALDAVPVGICLLDRKHTAIFVNSFAREVFAQDDGLCLTAHGIKAARPTENKALEAAISSACRSAPSSLEANGGVITVSRPSGRRSFTVLVSPVRIATFSLARDVPASIVLIADPESDLSAIESLASGLYGLTPTETHVLKLLVQGESVARIADALTVTENTARTHLKRIFAKTGACSQADLVGIVSRGVAQVARAAARHTDTKVDG